MNSRRAFAGGLLALALLLLVLAVVRPLSLPDEGRYGDVGRWMLVSGDWLAPRLDGLPFFHKPPLLHWLQAASMAVFGVHAWSARLVPMAHAALMVAALYLAARGIDGERVARRATWMLATSLGILVGGQYVNHDMLVAAWVGVAIWCLGGALLTSGAPSRRLAWVGFAACGLGVLAKGLIGLVLPGMVLFVWLFLVRRWPRALRLPWLTGLGLFAVVALPWFVLAQRQYPGLFDYLIIGQHFRRYTGSGFNNQFPVWFYLAVLGVMLFPWALLAAWDGLRTLAREKAAVLRAPDPWTALLWTWLLVITLFFSLPKSKLVGYVLPVLPPLALLAARAWESRWGGRARAGWAFAGVCAVNIVLAVAASELAGRSTLKQSSQDVAAALACRMTPGQAVWVAGGYPYDLPFLADLKQPVVVVEDWPTARRTAGDNWRRELFEGADFDPAAAARVLRTPEVLQAPAPSGAWLVTSREMGASFASPHWRKVGEGRAWTLWRAAGSAGEGPEATEHEGLACGQHQRHE